MDETDRAVLTAVGSLVVAVVAALLAARNAKRLTKLNAELEGRRSAEDARQEYEYEARKRLYHQCQPLIFQANEMAVYSRSRVVSLARSGRGQHLPDWLNGHGYYFMSTVYFLLAPVTTAKILQRRLTALDLSLDTDLQRQYELLKLVFITFTDAFDLAAQAPALDYDPDRDVLRGREGARLLREHPAIYRRQGFYVGTLERIAEVLIRDKDGEARCATFGEFVIDFPQDQSPLTDVIPALDEIFLGFHPEQRPVLWRVLIAQSLLADLVLRSQQASGRTLSSLLPEVEPGLVKEFDWRTEKERESIGDEVVAEPLRVALAHLAVSVGRVDERLGGQEVS